MRISVWIKKVTIKDLSKALNVVPSIISKALTNKRGVSNEKAVIFQDPVQQGMVATEVIYRHLVEGKEDKSNILSAPTVILKNSII